MKKLLSVALAATMCATLVAGCSSNGGNNEAKTTKAAENGSQAAATTGAAKSASDVKVGVIYIGDENEGYTESHMKGIDEMQKALGLSDDQVIEKTLIGETEQCRDAAEDLAESGCNIIFATSFGHESFVMEVAKEYPDIQFCHATGYQAADSGLANMHNYFTNIYEARYVAGVAAGMKLNEMIDKGTIKAEEAKIGYVGAYPYAEVVSGYTAFYLGAKSICESATMEVQYTNSWADITLEKETAEALVADKCVLISQHADTTGAPTACEALGVPNVGYNVSMNAVAPNTSITSPTNDWSHYYTYAVQSVIDGTAIDTDWCKGFGDGSVALTELNEKVAVEGTAAKLEEVKKSIMDGKLHVFDTSTFTVNNGQKLEDAIKAGGDFAKFADYVSDGYFHESEKNLLQHLKFELMVLQKNLATN
ncbi:Basic membrane lipoprotein [Lachnospiraceae bacterium TWA4]|nr:Basic membrane lipoprotein [Lachnospiraceae bacterium TWA4]